MSRYRQPARNRARHSAVRWNGDLQVDLKRAADRVAQLVIAAQKRNFARGRTADGKPTPPYSPEYKKRLRKAGHPTRKDFRLTGGLVASIEEIGRTVTTDSVIVTVGPNDEYSTKARLTDRGVFLDGPGVPYSVLALFLAADKRRPYGLARRSLKKLAKEIEDMLGFKLSRSISRSRRRQYLPTTYRK